MNSAGELVSFHVTNDHMFKSLFRSKEARGVIAGFLNEITGIDYDVLFSANYQGGEIPKQNENEKGKTSDCIVRIDNENKLIIEMNSSITKYISKKATDYAFGVITESTRTNNRYPNIILINIDNFNNYNTEKDILTFMIRDEEGHIENDLYTSYHVILENCPKSLYNKVKKFAKFLKMTSLDEMRKNFKGDEDYMDAIKKIESFTKDPEFIGYYNKEDRIELEKNEAHDIGFSQGIEQGIEQGRNNEKLEIAKNLKSQNISLETISKATGLTIEEIEKL